MTIDLPLFVVLKRKRKKDKKYYLNLNIYRNTHFHVLNQAKREYAEKVRLALISGGMTSHGIVDYPIELRYTLYASTRRRIDLTNVVSVIDKFTQDSLVGHGVIIDDSVEYIQKVTAVFGGISKHNPRCALEIFPIYNKQEE